MGEAAMQWKSAGARVKSIAGKSTVMSWKTAKRLASAVVGRGGSLGLKTSDRLAGFVAGCLGTRRRKAAGKLAACVEHYCGRYYQQVWISSLADELANASGTIGNLAPHTHRSTKLLKASSKLHGFYMAVIAVKTMFRFNDLAAQHGRLKPVANEYVVNLAINVVQGNLRLERTDAAEIVQSAVVQMKGFDAEVAAAKNMPRSMFDANVRQLGDKFARQLLLYCAAERSAEQLFDAWLADPYQLPEPNAAVVETLARLSERDISKPRVSFGMTPSTQNVEETQASSGHSLVAGQDFRKVLPRIFQGETVH